jgi:putative transposase
MVSLLKIAGLLVEDAFQWVLLLFRSTADLRAENLFLRRQLALYIERGGQPHRVDAATRISLALLARRFDWRGALVVVQPATMIRWHRAGRDCFGE